jgi:hypothetical protein
VVVAAVVVAEAVVEALAVPRAALAPLVSLARRTGERPRRSRMVVASPLHCRVGHTLAARLAVEREYVHLRPFRLARAYQKGRAL